MSELATSTIANFEFGNFCETASMASVSVKPTAIVRS